MTNDEMPTPSASSIHRKLYISHALSTWNSRTFEFGAVLFLASIFPGTLFYASTYALLRALAATLLSSRIGTYVDGTDRLVAIRHSIIWQRIPVALSCFTFLVLLKYPDSNLGFWLCFPLAVGLACLEKLANIANTVAVERDWVVVIAESTQSSLQDFNSVLRRIDLVCKLVSPLFISLVAAYSTNVAVLLVMGMSTMSSVLEYVAIARVYHAVGQLGDKSLSRPPLLDGETTSTNSRHATVAATSMKEHAFEILEPWMNYFTSPVFLASFALSMLYFTVLSTGVQFQTYLLAAGYSAIAVSLLRFAAVISELSATCFAPLLMSKIGPIRTGLWSINFQVVCLAIAVGSFLYFESMPIIAGAGLTAGIVLSRVGLWGFDLSVQNIVQEGAPEAHRGQFSASEMALQNLFELLSFTSTIVFPKPEQFKYPILISYGAIVVSAACFAAFVRQKRGHLLHASRCMKREKYQPVAQVELEALESGSGVS